MTFLSLVEVFVLRVINAYTDTYGVVLQPSTVGLPYYVMNLAWSAHSSGLGRIKERLSSLSSG